MAQFSKSSGQSATKKIRKSTVATLEAELSSEDENMADMVSPESRTEYARSRPIRAAAKPSKWDPISMLS